MNIRHLLKAEHSLKASLHQAYSSLQPTTILGVQSQTFYMLAATTAVILAIVFCIFYFYRRYRTRVMFNENPEQFPHRPDLGIFQARNLKNTKLLELIKGDADQSLVIEKKDDEHSGPYYKVTFKGSKPQAVFFELKQKSESCYFEIQIFHLHGEVQIGFVQEESFQQVKAGEQLIGVQGVSLTTSGLVVTNGENIFNYNWSLNYGDVIGLGVTKEHKKFMERRAWVSKNGLLENPPPFEEKDKWLATFNIDAEEREKFELGQIKERTDEVMDAEAAQKAAAAQKIAIEREQAVLTSKRISMKTFKEFKFIPVIYFQGSKGKAGKGTIVHINVGGQVFRMKEDKFKGGILN